MKLNFKKWELTKENKPEKKKKIAFIQVTNHFYRTWKNRGGKK